MNNSFSWGLSYRSKIEIDYEGDGRLTQVPTGNAAVRRRRAPAPAVRHRPAGRDRDRVPRHGEPRLRRRASPRDCSVETDVNWTGWSCFDEVVIGPSPARAVFGPNSNSRSRDTVIPEEWDDADNYRLGMRWTTGPGTEWRFGYVYDETPQPEEAVSPLLPDADRNGFTVGYGHDRRRLQVRTSR